MDSNNLGSLSLINNIEINENDSFSKKILYVDTSIDNQLVINKRCNIMIPKEISKRSIKNKLLIKNNIYCGSEKFIESCSGFLKMLYVKQYTSYDSEESNYIHFDSRILKQKFGSNQDRKPLYYKTIIDSLKDIGILEVNEDYYYTRGANGKSKGYRLLLDSPEEVEAQYIDSNLLSKSSIVDDSDYLSDLNKLNLDEYKYLFISNLMSKEQRESAMFIYYNWVNKYHFVRVDNYGRIHSLLTQMPKKLRGAFSFNGKPLYEVDLHACQPFLLLKIVLERLSENNKYSYSELISKYDELQRYISHIQNGSFYEHLYRITNNVKKAPIPIDKAKNFKISVFKNLFFSDTPNKEKLKTIHKVFIKEYPIIYEVLTAHKSYNGYQSVSRELQQYESQIMNHAIDLAKKSNPIGYYLRFHDAILCEKESCHVVKNILEKILFDFLGVEGRVKTGSLWEEDLYSVLNGLYIGYHLVWQNSKFDKFIGKEMQTAIKGLVLLHGKNVESKIKGIEDYIHFYYTDDTNKKRLEKIEKQYKQFKPSFPSHWDNSKLDSFKSYAVMQLDLYFNQKLNEVDNDSGKGIFNRSHSRLRKGFLDMKNNRLIPS